MTETTLDKPRNPLFELIAGNLCLDFVNTLDNRPSGEPKELLENYYDLAHFGEDAGILTREQLRLLFEQVRLMPNEADEAVRRARDLREALHEIFSALMNRQTAPHLAMEKLNANLHDAALHSRLVQPTEVQPKASESEKSQGPLVWRFDDVTSSFNAILWPIARAAAELLASNDVALVRTCSSPACQWFFLDTSKNHRRRWCDMKVCGNRAKVRKFYARKREGSGADI
ncbi:MAG: ABATE domain-containing protein [Candidatus Sulfotelmatobacter sp.]